MKEQKTGSQDKSANLLLRVDQQRFGGAERLFQDVDARSGGAGAGILSLGVLSVLVRQLLESQHDLRCSADKQTDKSTMRHGWLKWYQRAQQQRESEAKQKKRGGRAYARRQAELKRRWMQQRSEELLREASLALYVCPPHYSRQQQQERVHTQQEQGEEVEVREGEPEPAVAQQHQNQSLAQTFSRNRITANEYNR